jgi:hypothetical protein
MASASHSLHLIVVIFLLWETLVVLVTGLQSPLPPQLHNRPTVSSSSLTLQEGSCSSSFSSSPPLDDVAPSKNRREWIRQTTLGLMVTALTTTTTSNDVVHAAPPIAIIAEELGYFPVRSPKTGDVMYVPKRVTRPSSPQAIELAQRMKSQGITMYGTYWCPHCARQKELFGSEAWSIMSYVECSPKGYGYGVDKRTTKICTTKIDGYPTFRDDKGKVNISGERPLEVLAQAIGYVDFDPTLEKDDVPMLGSSNCKIR